MRVGKEGAAMKGLISVQTNQGKINKIDFPHHYDEIPASVQRPLNIVVPYTTPKLTRSALNLAAAYAGDLRAQVKLVFAHVVPYPLNLEEPNIQSGSIAKRIKREICCIQYPISVEIIFARDKNEALRSAVPAGSLVLLATEKHWWRTSEEKLAGALVRTGCNVTIVILQTGDGSESLTLQPPRRSQWPELAIRI
jgi:hypothetical protein